MRYARAVCITPRRLGLALCLLGFIWAMTLMNLSLVSRPDDVTSPDELRVSKIALNQVVLAASFSYPLWACSLGM